jgi:DNA polymerase
MARAAIGALPQGLGQCAPVIMPGLAKDGEGAALMMRMCKPPGHCPQDWIKANARKPPKGTPREEAKAFRAAEKARATQAWHDEGMDRQPAEPHTPANLARLAAYCRQDVVAELSVARSPQLPPMPAGEPAIRVLDSTINRRGVLVDLDLLRHARALLAPVRESGNAELADLTGGAVETANQVQAIRAWCAGQGLDLPDLTSETLEETLATDDLAKADGGPGLLPQVRRVLDLRASLGLSSLAKLEAAAAYVCRDGRLRDMLRYYRASTGRWAGAGFQPQNIPRPAFGRKSAAWAIERIKAGDIESLTTIYGRDIPATLTSLLRGLLIAPPGHMLMGADYSQIEARVLATLAGQSDRVALFRGKGKVYESMAARIYKLAVGDIGKDSLHRHVGKFTVLGCGYQMGGANFRKNLKKQAGIVLPLDECKHIVATYRDANPAIVAWWYALDDAAIAAVRKPGTVQEAGPIAFHCEEGRWLRMRLPSGRCLYYQRPSLKYDEKFGKWGVCYWGIDRYTSKWSEQRGYGGFWAENATQAASRDIMVAGMFAAEAAGFPLVLTVHDEELAEVPAARVDVKAFESCLIDHAPAWAAGVPLACEGWAADRYHK